MVSSSTVTLSTLIFWTLKLVKTTVSHRRKFAKQ